MKTPTVVCFHGLVGNGFYSFSEIAVLLEKHFHLLIFDGPGHGETTPFESEEDYLFSSIAMWYKRVIQQVLSKPFYLMGHSWGADIALHYTKGYPDEVLGIVLLDGGYIFPQNQSEMSFNYAIAGWDDYMNRSAYYEWAVIVEEYKTYTNRWNHIKECYVASLFKKKDNHFELVTSKFTVLSIIKAFFKEPFSETYAFIKVPVLLIHATNPTELDVAREIGILQLKENVDDVMIIGVEGAGHMLQWDEPLQTATEIKKWIYEKET
ncbi:alpha/beta fold hydrolase [Psychrobacillus vulpis]|uniref:Alpha/beta hydrolase n=1 Tax=Psychrobacillus vulpis TaxID=2325572 RepID=A0A544TTR0_9BACI|nr:alpha/beta hydrolase [Psychrobacillus vulpis]TQR20843.1 alpha/beta hydrolase [Psychrobacillus vulpis]